jgi:hypothetical protein
LGFVASASDVSLFVYKNGSQLAYLLLYVDDIILTTSSPDLLQSLTARLHSKFAMTDLGDLSYFLGFSVTRSTTGMQLSQRQYAIDLLQRAGMAECHPPPLQWIPEPSSQLLKAIWSPILPTIAAL